MISCVISGAAAFLDIAPWVVGFPVTTASIFVSFAISVLLLVGDRAWGFVPGLARATFISARRVATFTPTFRTTSQPPVEDGSWHRAFWVSAVTTWMPHHATIRRTASEVSHR